MTFTNLLVGQFSAALWKFPPPTSVVFLTDLFDAIVQQFVFLLSLSSPSFACSGTFYVSRLPTHSASFSSNSTLTSTPPPSLITTESRRQFVVVPTSIGAKLIDERSTASAVLSKTKRENSALAQDRRNFHQFIERMCILADQSW